MRSRIRWLVVATTSAVVLSFVVPLCLLVRTLAEDRAMAAADREARNLAILVSTLGSTPQLAQVVEATGTHGVARTSVLLTDGRVLGASAPGLGRDPDVRAALRGTAVSRTASDGGKIVLPIVVADGTDVVVSTVTPAQLHQGVERAWISIVALGLALLGGAVLVADRLGRRISRPLVGVAQTADRLSAGDLEARATASGTPETEHLARALNALAVRIEELLANERAMVADLSHRLRTPVTALRLDVDAVSEPQLSARLGEHLEVLQRDIDAIVREARRPVRENMPGTCDAGEVVRERVRFWTALAEDQDRHLAVRIAAGPLPVTLPRDDLRDVVDVLIDNVFAHTAETRGFAVTLDRHGDELRLVVSDSGEGIAPTGTGRERVGSTGLGLDIVRRTAAAGGGSVRVLSSPATGTSVEVRLPLAA